ncbi:MAG TPA: helix-turn-helix transcriptional regulator [Streptosporangiaceae bacterium]|nr:helix-turn-helix transcriptional regulator [Streptosporangiaceae bacterium]
MSPVFRHGSLRLYLLRLLDEEPRHGYEVIRLLRDRFMGVYSPSPGTIYPRLARLEEEGLVTHDEVDGRKVYRITEAGREELRSRSDELDELEEELSASVSDIVREVREDVRQTVRSLREELTWAARESRRMGQAAAADAREQAKQARDEALTQAREARDEAKEQARQARDEAREQARQARDQTKPAGEQAKQAGEQAKESYREAKEQVRQGREDPWEQATDEAEAEQPAAAESAARDRADAGGQDTARRVREHARRLRDEAQRVREEAGARFTSGEDWDTPPGWAGRPSWTEWPGRRGWEEWTRGRRGWTGALDFGTLKDLERVAVQFTSDVRKLAMQSSVVGENVITDLRTILEEALERIKTEIFGPEQGPEGSEPGPEGGEPGPEGGQQGPEGGQQSARAASTPPSAEAPAEESKDSEA